MAGKKAEVVTQEIVLWQAYYLHLEASPTQLKLPLSTHLLEPIYRIHSPFLSFTPHTHLVKTYKFYLLNKIWIFHSSPSLHCHHTGPSHCSLSTRPLPRVLIHLLFIHDHFPEWSDLLFKRFASWNGTHPKQTVLTPYRRAQALRTPYKVCHLLFTPEKVILGIKVTRGYSNSKLVAWKKCKFFSLKEPEATFAWCFWLHGQKQEVENCCHIQETDGLDNATR